MLIKYILHICMINVTPPIKSLYPSQSLKAINRRDFHSDKLEKTTQQIFKAILKKTTINPNRKKGEQIQVLILFQDAMEKSLFMHTYTQNTTSIGQKVKIHSIQPGDRKSIEAQLKKQGSFIDLQFNTHTQDNKTQYHIQQNKQPVYDFVIVRSTSFNNDILKKLQDHKMPMINASGTPERAKNTYNDIRAFQDPQNNQLNLFSRGQHQQEFIKGLDLAYQHIQNLLV